jgi:hypothetical protein
MAKAKNLSGKSAARMAAVLNRRTDTHEVETADIAEAFEESALPCIHKRNLRHGLEHDPPQPAHTVTAD